jgi:hypothetical protein
MWEPRRLTTVWALKASHRDSFIFLSFSYLLSYYLTLLILNKDSVVKQPRIPNKSQCYIFNYPQIPCKIVRYYDPQFETQSLNVLNIHKAEV